jgi:hypothetical protein
LEGSKSSSAAVILSEAKLQRIPESFRGEATLPTSVVFVSQTAKKTPEIFES